MAGLGLVDSAEARARARARASTSLLCDQDKE